MSAGNQNSHTAISGQLTLPWLTWCLEKVIDNEILRYLPTRALLLVCRYLQTESKMSFLIATSSPIKINENYCLAAIFLFGDVERNGQNSRHLKFVIWWLKSCVRTSPGALINNLISDPVKWVLVSKNYNCVPQLRKVIYLKWLLSCAIC